MIEKTKEVASKTIFVLLIFNVIGLLIAKGFGITVIENVKKKLK
jgi:UPF0716 family protein affecting phage T7 exclusion